MEFVLLPVRVGHFHLFPNILQFGGTMWRWRHWTTHRRQILPDDLIPVPLRAIVRQLVDLCQGNEQETRSVRDEVAQFFGPRQHLSGRFRASQDLILQGQTLKSF